MSYKFVSSNKFEVQVQPNPYLEPRYNQPRATAYRTASENCRRVESLALGTGAIPDQGSRALIIQQVCRDSFLVASKPVFHVNNNCIHLQHVQDLQYVQ